MFNERAMKICTEYTYHQDRIRQSVKDTVKKQCELIVLMVEKYPISTADEPDDLATETRWIEEEVARLPKMLRLLRELVPLV